MVPSLPLVSQHLPLAYAAVRARTASLDPADLVMAHIAATKLHDPRIEVLCGDIETIEIPRRYDCCVVYNAFPHFPDPQRLITRLAELLAPGGRLTVAHGMSLEALRRRHAGAAQPVSRPMLQPEELAALMRPALTVDTMLSDEEKYVVSAHL